MKLRYTLSRTDLFRSSLRTQLMNRSARIVLACALCYVVGSGLHSGLRDGREYSYLITHAVVSVVLFGAIIGTLTLMLVAINVLAGKGRGVMGEHTLEISDAGLIERTEFNESLHRWPAITRVATVGGFHLIRITDFGGAYHVIPRRAGAVLEGDADAFTQEVARRIASTEAS